MSVLVLCKFTPLGFETRAGRGSEYKHRHGCKFTPLGFETSDLKNYLLQTNERVNLPRWGLKQRPNIQESAESKGVNLPRWGLKRLRNIFYGLRVSSVNLPRWGLKLIWIRRWRTTSKV